MFRCLITGFGTPATPGTLKMLKENPDGIPMVTYGVDSNPQSPSRALVDCFFCIPKWEEPNYLSFLLDLCTKEQIDVVVFQHDQDLLLCMEQKERFEKAGVRLLCAEAETLRIATDKGKLYCALQGTGIPVPKFREVSRETCEEVAYAMGYPERDLVVKPSRAWGAKGVYQITEQPLLWDRRSRLPTATLSQLKKSIKDPVLLMEALSGEEFSVDAFLGESTAIAIPRRRDQILGAFASQTTLVHRPDLANYTLEAGRVLGLRYLYGMQFRCDEKGEPKLLECNPRIQGSSIASLYSGVNLLWMAIQELLGSEPTEAPEPSHGITFARHWGGSII